MLLEQREGRQGGDHQGGIVRLGRRRSDGFLSLACRLGARWGFTGMRLGVWGQGEGNGVWVIIGRLLEEFLEGQEGHGITGLV